MMEPRIPSLHRNKSISPRPKAAPPLEREPRNHRLVRVFPLLLLTIYSVTSILRLASSQNYLNQFNLSSSSSNSLNQSKAFVAETSRDIDSLKTHISSKENHLQVHEEKGEVAVLVSCSSLISGQMDSATRSRKDTSLLCCDRSHYRTDICYMTGDVRTDSKLTSIFVYGSGLGGSPEKIRPYTRKWETNIMNTIDELTLVPTPVNGSRTCEVRHEVPAVVFSTGGYTGNVYHEFNDGLIPLYITVERFAGEVVLVVVEYHPWWVTKYESVLKKLSNYKLVDFKKDKRVHCFPEVIVGLKIHGELTIDPLLMPNGKGIQDFQGLLRRGFGVGGQTLQQQPPMPNLRLPSIKSSGAPKKPIIAIFIRNKSRELLNLKDIVKKCQKVGFQVHILNPKRSTPLSEIFTTLDSADAMLAVHGAAMTHLLFMRPGSVLMQVVPLGLDWPADEYYGQPARKLGLEYMEYKLIPEESSLLRKYGWHDPVIADPSAITSRGWQVTKRIYLEHQNVRLDLRRFDALLLKAYAHIISKLPPKL